MITGTRKINVLGTDIRIEIREEKDDEKLKNCLGYFDSTMHLIAVKKVIPDALTYGDLDSLQKEVLRHEVMHAFFYESGLDGSSGSVENWATNEEMVDWFAIQSPKIFRVFQELGVL